MKELKFIHIPKTAGTSIEKQAIEKKIHWGVYDQVLNNPSLYTNSSFHHWSLRYLKSKELKDKLKEKYDFFFVVRNPYTRLVSLINHISSNVFKFGLNRYLVNNDLKNNSNINIFIRDILKDKCNLSYCPQVNFLFDNDGKLLVDNICYYEDLHDDFSKLMNKYNLDVTLEKEITHMVDYKFFVNDLEPETIKIINEFYRDDFESLGYETINVESVL